MRDDPTILVVRYDCYFHIFVLFFFRKYYLFEARSKMDYKEILGLKISDFTLGTVQFGLDYGIANKSGKPSEDEVMEILGAASEAGINTLDTAHSYGDSEELIGGFGGDFVVVSKLPSLEGISEVEGVVRESLERLGVSKIPIYMLHRAVDMSSDLLKELLRLKDEGLIGHVGVSIYTPDEAMSALETDGVDAIQVPFNVFDRRLVRSGFLAKAEEKGVAVFARSVFLQGLLLMDDEDVPENIKDAIPYKHKLAVICEKFGRTLPEVVLKYPLSQEGITSVIFGVDNLSQLKDNLAVIESPALEDALIDEIREAFLDVPDHLVDTSLWVKT